MACGGGAARTQSGSSREHGACAGLLSWRGDSGQRCACLKSWGLYVVGDGAHIGVLRWWGGGLQMTHVSEP